MSILEGLDGTWVTHRDRVHGGRKAKCIKRGPHGERCGYRADHSGKCAWMIHADVRIGRDVGEHALGRGTRVRAVPSYRAEHRTTGVVEDVAPRPAKARLVLWDCGCRAWAPERLLREAKR
jgi:hypothetical protein